MFTTRKIECPSEFTTLNPVWLAYVNRYELTIPQAKARGCAMICPKYGDLTLV